MEMHASWNEDTYLIAINILDRVFNELNYWVDGEWYARPENSQHATCCKSCGWVEIYEEFRDDNNIDDDISYPENVVFYTSQDLAFLKEDGKLYLSWSGDWKLIKEYFELHGCFVRADGNKSIEINFTGNMKGLYQ
jgi:hypothetical protein